MLGVGLTWLNMNFGCGPVWVRVLLVWNLGNLNQLFVMPFGVILFFKNFCGGVVCLWGFAGDGVCFMRCWGFRAICFWPLYCWIYGWGLVMWLNTRLLVANYFLHTCILFPRPCTATTTGRLIWGVAFWLSLRVITLPNLGCVGSMVEVCTVLRLHRLVVNYLLSCGRLVGFFCFFFVGLWHNFCILSQLVRLKECKG